MNQKYITICFLAVLSVIQCDRETDYNPDCIYSDISGYVKLIKIDTALSKNLPENYKYYWSSFISSDFSDTINWCYYIVNTSCLSEGTITLDSLFPCIWKKKISGGCSPGPIKINSIPDTCYIGESFKYYE